MHARVEEDEQLNPLQVFLDLGTLLLEARIPGGGSLGRGYGEGPHIPSYLSATSTYQQTRHSCTSNTSTCRRWNRLRQHQHLLWQAGVPLCLEVLLGPDCSHGKTAALPGLASMPQTHCVILERWHVQFIQQPKSLPDPSTSSPARVSPLCLLQAVRSFLHFSQLSAWLQRSNGKEPRHILFRVTLPIPSANTFSPFPSNVTPGEHHFPLASFGLSAQLAIKVTVTATPRAENIPARPCTQCENKKNLSPAPGGIIFEEEQELGEESFEEELLWEAGRARGGPICWGESLLDPPTERLESPTRSHLPSTEAPERLLLGSRHPSRLSVLNHTPASTRRCSPQRQPSVRTWPLVDGPLQGNNVLDGCLALTGKTSDLCKKNTWNASRNCSVLLENELERALLEIRSLTLTKNGSSPRGRVSRKDGYHLNANLTSASVRKVLAEFGSLDGNSGDKQQSPTSRSVRNVKPRCRIRPMAESRPGFSKMRGLLLGNFEESLLQGRLPSCAVVEGFHINLGASGSFCPSQKMLPASTSFYQLPGDPLTLPYVAVVPLGIKGYLIPSKGKVQVTLFSPQGSVVKVWLVNFDVEALPPKSHTFIRQISYYRTLPHHGTNCYASTKRLRDLIHLRFSVSKSGRVYLHSDVKLIIFRRADQDFGQGLTLHHTSTSEDWLTVVQRPVQPAYSQL